MDQDQIQTLLASSKDPQLMGEVFEFAKNSYQDKTRISGESYLAHAVNVALILGQMNLDQTTVITGMLHDILEGLPLPAKLAAQEEISKKFGTQIANLVARVAEVKKIYYSFNVSIERSEFFSKDKAENLRKMFFAIAKDLRVVLVELASRVDGLNNIARLPQENQKLYAIETLEIFVPIANRLGLGEIKTTLEDLAFAHLYQEKFQWLQSNIKEKYQARQEYLKKYIPVLKKNFSQEKINTLDINYRAKSYWSTYKKLLTHDMDFEKIHDLVALRIIVPDIESCYKTLGIIHTYYKPIALKEINDYIAKPKQNGYQSLHTTVFLDDTTISEIQIKTQAMHQEAEYGVCAHWLYKENLDPKKDAETVAWTQKVRQLKNAFHINFFDDQIFAFTPKGDVIALPKGSTAIDFAYGVHSDVGNHCESAKIDGKIITLTQPLNNGDVVEIITNRKRTPSQDWLRSVKTSFARSHIKKIITSIPLSLFSVPNFVKSKIIEISSRNKKPPEKKLATKKTASKELYLAGQKGMLVNFAKCCSPKPGDPAKAYLTKYRSAVLHQVSCVNLQTLAKKFPEKIIEATWQES